MPLLLLPQSGDNPPPPIPVLPHYPVTAELLDYDGTPVPGDPLATALDVNWYDEENGPGRGGITMALSEAGAAELLPGRYVNCLVNGQVDFTFKIEGNPQYKVIEEGEEYAQTVTVTGRGWTCIFDEALVYPEYALDFSLQTTWRLFSFASALFPNGHTWDLAVEQAEYLDGVVEADCYGHWQRAPDGLVYPAPIGWPWGTNPANLVNGTKTSNYEDTFWLRTANQPSYVSTGYYFFRSSFVLTDSLTAVKFTCTGDNFFTLFLEGVPILGEKFGGNNDHLMWQGWKEQTIFLPAGTYTVAAVVYNISFADMGAGAPVDSPPCPAEGWPGGLRYDNPGGLLAAIYVDGGIDSDPVAILMSNDSWTAYYDPTNWPGWTPGQVFTQLNDESILNGSLTIYNGGTWSDFLDSNSLEWRPNDASVTRPDMPIFAAEVGKSIMQSLTKAYQEGWIRWHGQPGTFMLDIYRGLLPTSPAASATFSWATNLLSLERNATTPYANAVLVQWANGYLPVTDVGAIAAYDTKVEVMYSADAPSEEEAQRQGENQLSIAAQSAYPSIIAVVEPRYDGEYPYLGFRVGSYVEVPAVGGGTEVVRVLSIACKQNDEGWPIWTLELNQKLDVPERRNTELLQQIGGRQQVIRGTVTGG